MTDPGDGSPTFDPRYDPRFQPGYVPPDDDESGGVRSLSPERVDDLHSLSSEDNRCLSLSKGEVETRPFPFLQRSSGRAASSRNEVASERRRPWFNRFHLALWLYGAVLTFASLGLRILLGLNVSSHGPLGEVLPNLLWNVAPAVLPSSLIALVGALFLSATQRRRTQLQKREARSAPQLSWPVSAGLWVLALLLVAAAGAGQVWSIRQSALNSVGGRDILRGLLRVVVLDSMVVPALFLTGLLAVIVLIVLGIWHRMHSETNPWLKGLWIGSVAAAVAGIALLSKQVPSGAGEFESTTLQDAVAIPVHVPDVGDALLRTIYIAAPTVIEFSLITIVGLLMFHAWTWRKPS